MGRHSSEHVYELGTQDIECAMQILGDKPFLLGNEICDIDIIIFSFLLCVYTVPFQFGTKKQGLPRKKKVLEYLGRVQKIVYPEVDTWEKFHKDSVKNVRL